MKTRGDMFVFPETFVKGIDPHFFVHENIIAYYQTALVKLEE